MSRAKQQKLGDPFDPTTTQGPQVDEAQMNRILGYVDSGKTEGAECITGGKRWGSQGYYVEPTIFTGVKDEMKIAREEIFGPVMQIMSFKDVDEVISRGNRTDFGLAAAVWTRDVKKAHAMANSLRAGTVWVNCYDVFDAAAPFGGYKMSGTGREESISELMAFTSRMMLIPRLPNCAAKRRAKSSRSSNCATVICLV